MKVYIIKYALTMGILEYEAKVIENVPTMIECETKEGWPVYYHKPDWHESKTAAIEIAEQMKVKKIKSLEYQLKKLKDKKF